MTRQRSILATRGDDGAGPDDIAVVVPVYMGKRMLAELCERLVAALETFTERFAIVLVDDRSPDNAWPLICELGRADPRIKGIQMARNFGQHHALMAGIDHARARWYCVMDCDLQDAPEDVPLLFAKTAEGYDIVVGVRRKEGHGFLKRRQSRLFYAVFNLLAGIDLEWDVGNFRVFSDRVARGLREMREHVRFLPANLKVMGFEVGSVALPHHERAAGKSSYTFIKLFRLASDIILAHSQTPLKLAATLGFVMAFVSFAIALGLIARNLIWGASVVGWTSLIVAVFIVGGIQIFVTGVVGIYVGKCFEEAKRRPLYFVRETVNIDEATRLPIDDAANAGPPPWERARA